MAKQLLNEDGLPILNKAKTTQETTSDGLPIIKKKEPTPSGSLKPSSPFPSTSGNPLANFDSQKLKDEENKRYDPINNPYPDDDYTRGAGEVNPKQQKQVREVEDIKSSVKPWEEKGVNLNTGEFQMVQDATANVDRSISPKIESYERTVNKEGISVLKPKFVDERRKQKNLTDADAKKAAEYTEGVDSYAAQAYNSAVQGFGAMAKGVGLAVASMYMKTNPATGNKYLPYGQKLDDFGAYKLGQLIDQAAVYQDPREGSMLDKVAQGAGSLIPFILGGVAGKAFKLGEYVTPTLMGATQNGASQFDEALASGADTNTAMQAYWRGTLIGSLEGLPIGKWAEKLNKTYKGQLDEAIGEALKKRRVNSPGWLETSLEGLQEGAQEFASGVLNNANAMTLYDETRKLFDNAFEDGGIGFLLGGVMNGVTNSLQQRKSDPNLTPSEKVQVDKAIEYVEKVQEKMKDAESDDFIKPMDDSPEVQALKEQKVELESDIADPSIAPELKEQIAEKVAEVDEKIAETKEAEIQADAQMVATEGQIADLEAGKTALEEQAKTASETTKKEILQPQIDDFLSQIEALKETIPAAEEVVAPTESTETQAQENVPLTNEGNNLEVVENKPVEVSENPVLKDSFENRETIEKKLNEFGEGLYYHGSNDISYLNNVQDINTAENTSNAKSKYLFITPKPSTAISYSINSGEIGEKSGVAAFKLKGKGYTMKNGDIKNLKTMEDYENFLDQKKQEGYDYVKIPQDGANVVVLNNSSIEYIGKKKNTESLLTEQPTTNITKNEQPTNTTEPTLKQQEVVTGNSETSVSEPIQETDKPITEVKKKGRGNTGKTPRSKRKLKGARLEAARIENTNSPYERVLQHFAAGNTISFAAIKSLFNSSTEAKKSINLVGGTKGLDAVAHDIYMNHMDDERFDAQDYKNAIEEALRTHSNPSKMAEELLDLHKDEISDETARELDYQRRVQESNPWESDPLTDEAISEIAYEELSKMTDEQIQELAEGKDKIDELMAQDMLDNWLEENGMDEGPTPWDEEVISETNKPTKETIAKFAEANRLYQEISDADSGTKKRRLAEERRAFMESNPSIKAIDDNIKAIHQQLEKQGVIERKGDCP